MQDSSNAEPLTASELQDVSERVAHARQLLNTLDATQVNIHTHPALQSDITFIKLALPRVRATSSFDRLDDSSVDVELIPQALQCEEDLVGILQMYDSIQAALAYS